MNNIKSFTLANQYWLNIGKIDILGYYKNRAYVAQELLARASLWV